VFSVERERGVGRCGFLGVFSAHLRTERMINIRNNISSKKKIFAMCDKTFSSP
jgi:hypothetical protein